jgi:hypothetical protein
VNAASFPVRLAHGAGARRSHGARARPPGRGERAVGGAGRRKGPGDPEERPKGVKVDDGDIN